MSDVVERIRKHIANRGGPAKDAEGNYVGTVWPMMLEAADEIERLRAGWQPIETAPKNIPVLIYVPINRPERRILAAEKGDVEWYILSGSVVLGKPTKWQPLPAPPCAKTEVQA